MEEIKCVQVAQLEGKFDMVGRVYSQDGLCPSIRTMQGGGLQPKIAEPIVYDGYNGRIRADQSCVGTLTGNCGSDLKRNGQGIIEQLANDVNNDGVFPFRVRRLTPRECWRLMGFGDSDFDKAKWMTKEESEEFLKKYKKHKGKRQFTHEERIERMSDSQLYKQAGNSIVVNVLEAVFLQLFQ